MKWFIVSLLLLSGCASVPSAQQRLNNAAQLAAQKGWQAQLIKTQTFDLISYVPSTIKKDSLLSVYIEGDGFAWRTQTTPSTDPTPINPVGLKLALEHGVGNAAYLARPCQYVDEPARECSKSDWTDKRFSEEVIAASNEALTSLKQQFGATKLQLIGYSGGGAVATLLSARRSDVTNLITIAGNLDHKAWTKLHKISPLIGSLNPADYRDQLTHINQLHFGGENDQVIPLFLIEDFVKGLSDQTKVKVISIPDQTHYCCWENGWNELMLEYSF